MILVFLFGLTSFSIMISSSIHVATNGHYLVLYFFWPSSTLFMCVFCACSSINGHSGCFHVSAIGNSAAVDMYLFWIIGFFLDICPGAELLDHMAALFLNFLRKLHIVFHSGCTSFHFYQQYRRVLFSTPSPEHLLFVDFLMVAILTSVRWYLIVVLISFSLIAMLSIFPCACWPSICMSSLEKCLFSPSAHFSFGLLYKLYILEIKPLSVTSLANIFSHSVGCLFILFMVSFAVQKPIRLIRSHLFVFAFISISLGDWPKKTLAQFMSENVACVPVIWCHVLCLSL